MVALELRDPTAGTIARSYLPEDCLMFLRRVLARKRREVTELRKIDPFGSALAGTEIRRLEQILELISEQGTEGLTHGR